jgi:transcription factor C subunit 3
MARTTLRARSSQITPVADSENKTDQDTTTMTTEVAVKTENEVISINEVESIKPDIVSDGPKKRRSEKKPIIKVSLKGKRRRLQLIEIIKELGGVTYTTAKLRRSLDERLGVSTTTDIKTLARDISILISTGELEAETIEFERSGQLVKRRLLILTDEKLKPSKEAIEQAKEECLADNGVRNKARDRRIIEGEVTLYETSRPIGKKTKPRLESLGRGRGGPGVEASTKKERTSGGKSKRQVKASLESDNVGNDSELMDLDNDVDVLPELVSKKHKRKIKPAKIKKETSKLTRRFRQTIKFDKSDATTLFRAVVISKSFKRGGIDFEQIALLFDDADEKVIKQKWTMVRKKVGGLQAVTKGKEAFEHIVIKGIEEGVVTTEDLEDIKFSFFLQLWKETDNSVLEAFDKTPLQSSVQDNLSMYNRTEVQETVGDLFEQLEDNSMRQKESILARKTFYNVDLPEITSKDHDELRTVLKAIISTPEEKYTAAQVKQILAQYDDEETKQASMALIRDREMLYYGTDDVTTRFVLTERVQNSLNVKLKPKFFTQAAGFKAHVQSIFEANKGLILSQGIANGEVAALLQLLSTKKTAICHIDKSQLPDGYESRLVDKEKLACDIVAFNDDANAIEDIVSDKRVPIPIGRPCSHIWLDVNGNINEQLWTKIIVAILYFISFRPGIPPYVIYNKLLTVLGYHDFFAVTDWLKSSNYIRQGNYDGYWVTNEWSTVLGF